MIFIPGARSCVAVFVLAALAPRFLGHAEPACGPGDAMRAICDFMPGAWPLCLRVTRIARAAEISIWSTLRADRVETGVFVFAEAFLRIPRRTGAIHAGRDSSASEPFRRILSRPRFPLPCQNPRALTAALPRVIPAGESSCRRPSDSHGDKRVRHSTTCRQVPVASVEDVATHTRMPRTRRSCLRPELSSRPGGGYFRALGFTVSMV